LWWLAPFSFRFGGQTHSDGRICDVSAKMLRVRGVVVDFGS
jgi:hypothetical protein